MTLVGRIVDTWTGESRDTKLKIAKQLSEMEHSRNLSMWKKIIARTFKSPCHFFYIWFQLTFDICPQYIWGSIYERYDSCTSKCPLYSRWRIWLMDICDASAIKVSCCFFDWKENILSSVLKKHDVQKKNLKHYICTILIASIVSI